MDIRLKLKPGVISRLQTRAEAVVHHGRRHDRPWADGASESDIIAVLALTDDNGQIAHLRWRGKYIYLGVGRGYLDLGSIGQWRLGHDITMTRDVAFPHADIVSITRKIGFSPRSARVISIFDPGAIAYITDHLLGDEDDNI